MEIITDIRFEDVLAIMEPEEDDVLDYAIEDLDGNWIMRDSLYILDFYQVRKWKVNKIKVAPDGVVTFILNGGNFRDFHFRNVH